MNYTPLNYSRNHFRILCESSILAKNFPALLMIFFNSLQNCHFLGCLSLDLIKYSWMRALSIHEMIPYSLTYQLFMDILSITHRFWSRFTPVDSVSKYTSLHSQYMAKTANFVKLVQ